MLDPIGTGGRQPPEHRTSDRYEIRAERQPLEHVDPALHATVDHEQRTVADGRHYLRERVDGRERRVELPAAVVADPDAVAAGVDGSDRVIGAQDPLRDKRNRADGAQPGEVLPGERRQLDDSGLVGRLVRWQMDTEMEHEPVAPVTLPVAGKRQVDGDRHRLVAGGRGAFDEALAGGPIGRRVELEPARGIGRRGGDLLHRHR